MAEKRGELVGDGITEEVLASSTSLFDKTAFGLGTKGLQQHFSPEQLGKLVADVLGRNVSVLDPTAGDGRLIAEWDKPFSYGIELDKDQIKASDGGYNAIRGDIQHVFPLLAHTMPEWNAIACNPPFGLKWQDPTVNSGKPTNSTLMSFIYCMRLLDESGQLAFICGRDRFHKQIAHLPEAEGIYAVVEVEGELFKDVMLPCVAAFGIHPGNRSGESVGFTERKATIDTLDLMAPWVTDLRQKALGSYNRVATRAYGHHTLPDAFKAVQSEYDRRVEKRLGKGARAEFDGSVQNAKIVWKPGAYAQLALRRHDDYHTLQHVNGQSINYFVNNERLWNSLMDYAEGGIITLDPLLVQMVEETLEEMRRTVCPLYPIKVTQRLGFLSDISQLRCIVSDPAKGFIAGSSYPLETKTQPLVRTWSEPVESKKNPGEWETKKFESYQQVLSVKIGTWKFNDGDDDASDNIAFLVRHFHMPDPGDVKVRHPEAIGKLEAVADGILDEFLIRSREWETKHPKVMPFTKRKFQREDISRLVFKGSGLLSWEQGLGKTVGGLLFASMCVRLGAQNARLIICPKDLIPQWQREIKRFYGVEAEVIKPEKLKQWVLDKKTGEMVQKDVSDVHVQAQRIAKHVRKGGKGVYITYYEALSIVGTNRSRPLPVVTVKEWQEDRQVKGTDKWGYFYFDINTLDATERETLDLYNGRYSTVDPETGDTIFKRCPQVIVDSEYSVVPEGCKAQYGHIRAQYEKITKRLTSKELCPSCEADYRNGWNGTICSYKRADGSICNYAHYESRVKPMASLLSSAFHKGVIIMDEGTLIQGDEAKRSIALRGLNARNKLLMTGTPIKNYVGQAFWLLWWCLGNASKRFPFDYQQGKTLFENEFSVIRYTKNGNRKEARKVLPDVTNISLLWRLLCSSIVRRRKEETGEKIVPKFFHEIRVPLGYTQAQFMQKWLKDFPIHFKEKHPDSKLAKAGLDVIRLWAPQVGLNHKLDYSCTLPIVDPDVEWPGIEDVSGFTPGNYKLMELTMALVKNGRKVLIGSNLKRPPRWIVEQLEEKGIKAAHILDGQDNTANPDKRAEKVYSFQTDDVQVFAAGVNAIRLGHNLDAADAVILHGLDWSYDTLDQFINRVHRLTSKNPIDVFVILPSLEGQETITTRKWQILGMKKGAAELALDGRLIEQHEQKIDTNAIMQELVARGLEITDDAVDEQDIEALWEKLPNIEDFEVTEGMIPHTVLPPTHEWTEEDAQAAFELYETLFPKPEQLAIAQHSEGIIEALAPAKKQHAVEEEDEETIFGQQEFVVYDDLDALEHAALVAAAEAASDESKEQVTFDTYSFDHRFGPKWAVQAEDAGVSSSVEQEPVALVPAAPAVEPEGAPAAAPPAPAVDPLAADPRDTIIQQQADMLKQQGEMLAQMQQQLATLTAALAPKVTEAERVGQ